MNEFEWRKQLRQINQPVKPPHDLWQRIDAALETSTVATEPNAAARPRRTWAAVASAAAVIVIAASIGWHVRTTTTPAQAVVSAPTQVKAAPWKPADPRLAGAAIELDAARMELQQAMQQSPDSPGLQRLLQRTDQQQSRLRELEKQSG